MLEIYIFLQNKSSLLFLDYLVGRDNFVIELQNSYIVCAPSFSCLSNLFLY